TPAVTTAAVTAVSAAPSYVGQAVTFTARVNVTSSTGASNDSPANRGFMKFFVDGTFVGLGTLVAGSGTTTSASWQFTTSQLAIGSRSIQVQFVTDNANYAWSGLSSAFSQPVNPPQTPTQLVTSPAVWSTDVPTTFTANVTYANGYAGSLISGGSVQFILDGATTLATVTQAAAFADHVSFSYTTSTLPAGSHTVSAVYSSTNASIAGSSDSRSQTIHKFSNLVLSAANSPTLGGPVLFTAAFTG